MAELADAMDSKSIDRKIMGVRLSLWAHWKLLRKNRDSRSNKTLYNISYNKS